MKKFLSVLIAVILTVIIFTGCKPLIPIDKDQFDLGDTVDIRVGETLYESDSIWVRLDSITKDTRIPAYYSIADTGLVEAYFTFGLNDSTHHFPLYFNYRAGGIISERYGLGNSYMYVNDGVCFVFWMINVLPIKLNDETFKQSEYIIRFFTDEVVVWVW